jgi:hypothetical protein
MILNNLIQKKEQQPLLNYVYNQSKQPFIQDYYQIHRKRRIKYLVERSPEASAIVDGHARDICGKFHFEPVTKNSSGKIKVNRAQRFVLKNRYKEERLGWIKDALITGDGFMFISELAKEQGDRLASEFKRIDPSFSDMSFRVRGLKAIASTTMSVEHNDFDITGYNQSLLGTAGGTDSQRRFNKEKIMHLMFDKPPGKVEGWTPLFTVSRFIIST